MSRTLQPPGWDQPSGYANGIEARGRMVFVAGQIGWDAQRKLVPGGFVAQAAQALANVVAVLREAGARPEHVVRLTWYVVDRQEYVASLRALGERYRAIMGRHYPAMTAVQVAALIEDGARVEVEATAVVPE
ncbi:MAG TPA: RidA family protein [Casimicrobiaceae bacterium]|jgi:enamine deaminase RidA (YjgF/YER057c/UK114 family)|nr:RidA family protein [Casimicrobiaceae bacterium]